MYNFKKKVTEFQTKLQCLIITSRLKDIYLKVICEQSFIKFIVFTKTTNLQ